MGSDRKKSKSSKNHRKRSSSSSSNSSNSDTWVEKSNASDNVKREDWMSMSGMLKTYTKEDIKPKRDEQKKQLDSYNPSTSSRELNPYWKDGGTGVPHTPESFKKANPYLKPRDADNYYRSSSSQARKEDKYKRESYSRSSNWRRRSSDKPDHHDKKRFVDSHPQSRHEDQPQTRQKNQEKELRDPEPTTKQSKLKDYLYLTDEKMNKLAAKVVKAEIMGDLHQANELKLKLEEARQYRKDNPNAGKEEENEGIMLIATNSTGNSRPLVKTTGDPRSKGGKRKADTHDTGGRNKYFANDDKYDLAQMFQNEKYTNNYDQEAEMAKIAAKHTNPNDDLEDIFVDEISKNKTSAKQGDRERQRAIEQHVRIEKSLDNCEFCLDSRNMIKHLMVSCGNKVYIALPGKKSLVKNHCIITTIHHVTCVTALDEDVWEEILDFRKALNNFFNSQNKDVVFFETATRLHKHPHLVINCVPIPRDVGDTLPIYFKKGLLECEAEWSMNKKVVDLKGKNIRKGIPKGLPYFWVDFGMDPGFAHVIEDQQLFPKTFAEEIIGGIMDLDHSLWMKPQKEYGDLQRKKVLDFVKEWKPFDTVSKNKT